MLFTERDWIHYVIRLVSPACKAYNSFSQHSHVYVHHAYNISQSCKQDTRWDETSQTEEEVKA